MQHCIVHAATLLQATVARNKVASCMGALRRERDINRTYSTKNIPNMLLKISLMYVHVHVCYVRALSELVTLDQSCVKVLGVCVPAYVRTFPSASTPCLYSIISPSLEIMALAMGSPAGPWTNLSLAMLSNICWNKREYHSLSTAAIDHTACAHVCTYVYLCMHI